MNSLNYLIPKTAAGSWTIAFLLVLFFIWTVIFLIWAFKLRRIRKAIITSADVEILSEELKTKPTNSIVDSNLAFTKFCEDKNLKESSIIAQHIKTIFDAGWKGSRLDIGELLKNTNNAVLKEFGILKSIQALFIIIGLLGTLLGLADSLAQLSNINLKDLVLSDANTNQGLTQFFEPLGAAFAPSITGILLTIVCAIILSLYTHYRGQQIKGLLEKQTFNEWVPKLFPATSHRFLQGVKLAQENMEITSLAIEELAKYSISIQTSTRAFIETLAEAHAPLEAIVSSVTTINKFTKIFSSSIDKLSAFQTDLKSLYQKMVDESATFHTNVNETLTVMTKSHAEFVTDTKKQGAYVKSVHESLKLFENEYLKERHSQDNSLREVLKESKKAYSAIHSRDDILNTIGNSLVTELQSVSKSVEKSTIDLSKKIEELGNLHVPSGNTDEITQAVSKFESAIDDLSLLLMEQIPKQISESTKIQPTEIVQNGRFDEIILNLLRENKEDRRKQEEQYNRLIKTLDKLTENISFSINRVSEPIIAQKPKTNPVQTILVQPTLSQPTSVSESKVFSETPVILNENNTNASEEISKPVTIQDEKNLEETIIPPPPREDIVFNSDDGKRTPFWTKVKNSVWRK